jgi:hypothetical protein
LVAKVQTLPEDVRSILQIASFIGYDFPTDALVTIVYEEQDMIQIEYSFERHSKEAIGARIVAALKLAVEEGLLETTPDCDDFKFSPRQDPTSAVRGFNARRHGEATVAPAHRDLDMEFCQGNGIIAT